VPFHLWITPDDHRAFFGIKRWNIDEERLLSQFVEPYRTGRPITTDGEVVSTDQLQKMRIARSDVQLAPRGRAVMRGARRPGQDHRPSRPSGGRENPQLWAPETEPEREVARLGQRLLFPTR